MLSPHPTACNLVVSCLRHPHGGGRHEEQNARTQGRKAARFYLWSRRPSRQTRRRLAAMAASAG